MELKLFVWTEFSPSYSDGLAFAIAETMEEAKKIIEDDRGCEIYDWGVVQAFPITKIGFSANGGD